MPANAARFTEIVTRERSRLGNFIRSQVRNAAEAEDILQDVLLEFYIATDAIEQAGAWLFRVAKNRIIDRARKKKEEPLPSADDEDGERERFRAGMRQWQSHGGAGDDSSAPTSASDSSSPKSSAQPPAPGEQR